MLRTAVPYTVLIGDDEAIAGKSCLCHTHSLATALVSCDPLLAVTYLEHPGLVQPLNPDLRSGFKTEGFVHWWAWAVEWWTEEREL